jgi:hypothetical protein
MGRSRPRGLASLCLRTLRTARARGRIGRGVLAVLQALVIALSVQLSGVHHVMADALFGEHAADCGGAGGDTSDDEDCPPGCPTCHTCAHAQVPYVRTPDVTTTTMASIAVPREWRDESPPPSGPRPPPDRPPRA